MVSNHVSAGIVKQIRVPRPSVDMNIIELVDKQLAGQDVEDAIELAVAHLYNLSADEYEIIVDSFKLDQEKRTNIVRQYRKKSQDGEKKTMIFNHYASSLSELDMQVIKCVPPGGNWKNIPESVPSQRLAQSLRIQSIPISIVQVMDAICIMIKTELYRKERRHVFRVSQIRLSSSDHLGR